MANPTGKQFTDFFEAFCHHFDCPPGKFEKTAFFKAVPPWKKPVVGVLFFVTPDLFDLDLDIIESLGKSQTREEFSGVLDEFHNAMRVTRSTLKSTFGMRMQGSRLMEIREELDSLIAPSVGRRKATPTVNPGTLGTTSPAVSPKSAAPAGPGATRAAYGPTESRALMLRKTRQAQTAVTAGTPLAQALADNGLEEPQFMELLAAESAANPSFGWLREQLLRERGLRETEEEIARLNRAVSDQSREIAELRDRLAHKA